MLNALRRFAELVAATLFALLFLVFLLQVFMRYVVNEPLGWTLEVSLVAYLWVVFWCAAFLVKEQEHIAFRLVYDAASPRVRRGFALASSIALCVGLPAALPASFDYISFMRIERTWTLELRFDMVFAVFLVFLLAVTVHAALRAFGLASKSWHKHL